MSTKFDLAAFLVSAAAAIDCGERTPVEKALENALAAMCDPSVVGDARRQVKDACDRLTAAMREMQKAAADEAQARMEERKTAAERLVEKMRRVQEDIRVATNRDNHQSMSGSDLQGLYDRLMAWLRDNEVPQEMKGRKE